MAKIFITGSADGLGLLAARELIRLHHEVVLHARNDRRAKDAMLQAPGAAGVFVADLADLGAVKAMAEKANARGGFDAVIHNAGIYHHSGNAAGVSALLTVNTLAPYVLTCLMNRPKRLIYLSSGMHRGGRLNPADLDNHSITYSDTKLHDLMLAKAVARHWPEVYSNAVDPGWVPTKMGGKNAPDRLEEGYATQVWLAESTNEAALVSGHYFHHKQKARHSPLADDLEMQAQLLAFCERQTGVKFGG